jgi:hypothetical protein
MAIYTVLSCETMGEYDALLMDKPVIISVLKKTIINHGEEF